jgi:hypothetical protein
VAGVAVVVERELFGGAVAGLEFVQFVCETPLLPAPRAGHRRGVLGALVGHVRGCVPTVLSVRLAVSNGDALFALDTDRAFAP